jgi:hypothetical protein
MQIFVDQLRNVLTLPPDNAKRALGPYLSCYYSRLSKLCTTLEKWEMDRQCPVISVPTKIIELQKIDKIGDGIMPHDISDILDISLGGVDDASLRISKIKELEKNSKKIIDMSIEQLNKQNRIENSYLAFVEQYGGKIPDLMKRQSLDVLRIARMLYRFFSSIVDGGDKYVPASDKTNPTDLIVSEFIMKDLTSVDGSKMNLGSIIDVITYINKELPQSTESKLTVTHNFDRFEIYRVLQKDLARLKSACNYVNRLKNIITLVPQNTQFIDAPSQININAIEARIMAIESALVVLAPKCCNCAGDVDNSVTDNLDCTRHPYCNKCAKADELIDMYKDCPICYYETYILAHYPSHSSKMSGNNSSEFCTPISHTINDESIERDL